MNLTRRSRRFGRLGFLLIAVMGGTMPVYATPTLPQSHAKPTPPLEQPQYAVSPTGERIAIPDSRSNAHHQVDVQGHQRWFVPGQPPQGQLAQPDEVGAERVIDGEDRTRVNTTTTYPYRAVVQIQLKFNGVADGCTGWLYDDNYVATAGHCILNRSGVWATNIVVSPGRNGSSYPYGSCGSANIFVSDLWQRDRTDNYDYGAIRLNCTIGAQTGTFGLNYNAGSWVNTSTTLLAYHGDKDAHTTQWSTVKPITRDTGYLLFYQHDTKGGASGAPVFFYQSGCGACVIAVNAQEYAPPTDNSGTKMNQGMFNFYNALR